MALKLICGPVSSGKTTRAIVAFLAALDRGESAVFVAPSGPDARHFQREIIRRLGENGKPGVLTGGKVATFDDLFLQLLNSAEPGVDVISSGERFLLMRAIVDAATNLRTLGLSATFDGFASALGDLIAEFEMTGMDSTGMAKTLRSWAAGNKWRQEFNKDLYSLYERYEAALRDKGAYDTELAQRRALEIFRQDPGNLGYDTVIVDGFWDFTPVQHSLLEALATASTVEALVTLPFEVNRAAYEAPAFHLQRLQKIAAPAADAAVPWVDSAAPAADSAAPAADDTDPAVSGERVPALEHLVKNLFREQGSMVDADGAVRQLLAAGSRGQAELVAAEILKLWRSGHDLDEIAIVCRNPGTDMSVIASVLAEFGVPFELPAAVSLSGAPVGKVALAALDFVAGSRSRASLLSYLRNPLSSAPLEKVDEFDRQVRKKGLEDNFELIAKWKIDVGSLVELDRLAKAAPRGAGSLGLELIAVIREFVTADEYVVRVPAADLRLDLLALASLETVCGEAEAAHNIMREADQEKSGESGGPAKSSRLSGCELLMSGIRQATVRVPSSSLRKCVRLLDPHRILNQRFKSVFICGLLEKQFPSFDREDAFFPDADRRELASAFNLSLDTRELRLAEERFLFFHTLSRARERVYLCYPSCDQEGKPNIPSLFVEDTIEIFEPGSIVNRNRSIGEVTFSPEEAPTAGQALRSLALFYDTDGKTNKKVLLAKAASAGLDVRLEGILDEAPPREPVIRDEHIIGILGAQSSFRVTDLQRYLRCPFVYFVETVLNPEDLQPLARGIHRGQLIHNILCRFNSQLSRAGLYLHQANPRQVEELRRQMAGYIEDEFVDTGSDLDAVILKTELRYHLDRYITREIECSRPLEYYDVEVGFGGKAAKCGGKNSSEAELVIDDFSLRGRLDRVDWEGKSNRGIVIDYKSSRRATSQDKFDGKKDVQILLYMLALKEVFGMEPIGGEYYALRGEERAGLYLQGHEHELGAGSCRLNEKDFVDSDTFAERLETARELARWAVNGIRGGQFPGDPYDEKKVCGYCGYDGICRRQSIPEKSGAE